MSRTTPTINRSKQTRATTVAKAARIKEAGLGGKRTGKSSATTNVAQAKRDTARAKGAALISAKSSTVAATKTAKSAQPSKGAPAKKKPAVATKPSAPKTTASKARKERPGPLVEVRTAHSVAGSSKLDAFVESVVASNLARFAGKLTRIDIYLSDENAEKKGSDDKRCQIEARPASAAPVSASAASTTIEKALTLAVGKMKRLLATHFDKKSRR